MSATRSAVVVPPIHDSFDRRSTRLDVPGLALYGTGMAHPFAPTFAHGTLAA